MYSAIRSSVILAGLLGVLPCFSAEMPIDIKTDLEGQYFIVEKTGSANKPVLVVKRAAANFAYYIKREFDCQAHTFRYLGEGESLEAMAATAVQPKPEMGAIKKGSISDQLARHACPKIESVGE